ncbi:hypothetical protein HPB47_020323 [Ixodes persulcatus]|uniref:Uncharacterized protein n=1 Tax=Ixodes persulcatus TaxID=34615 RepID=A0AC60QFR1_IXOPE|nr:hypothetical protein HPB47_020323 [Ixodes persulcatus]
MTPAQAQRGYDLEAMAWSTVSVDPIEEPPPGESLRHENLSKLVERHSRRRAKMASSTTLAESAPSTQHNGVQRAETSQGGSARKPKPKWKPRPLPRFHPSDYQVVLKPRTPMALREVFQCSELGEALKALRGETAAATLTLLPLWEQNLIVTGTPHADVADRILGDFQLTFPRGSILMRGNLKQTDNVCKGVITVANHETTASLQHKIQWRAGETVDIRKYGTSNVAQLSFEGQTVPRYVHYNSEVALVRRYKKNIPACVKCGTVGHRADTCSNPNGENCGLCGQKVSVVEVVRAPHDCQPKCATCGLAHATNSRDSTARPLEPLATRRSGGKPGHSGAVTKDGAPRQADVTKTKQRVPPAGGDVKGQQAPPPPPHGAKGQEAQTSKTDGTANAWARAVENGKQNIESEPEASSPTFAAALAEMEAHLNTKLTSMISKAMERVLTKVMEAVPAGPIRDVSSRSQSPKSSRRVVDSDTEDGYTPPRGLRLLSSPWGLALGRLPPFKSASPITITQWNCRGFRARFKRANLRLYLATFESLPAVVALQEPGMGATLTNYMTFQQDPSSSLRVAARDTLLIVGDFNAPSRPWGYHREEKRGRRLAELASTLGLTLETDPVHPTRLGNSVTRDTCPDLTFTHNIQHADWLNTEETLGTPHCLVRRWRWQKHNKTLKARIAELTQQAAEYAAQLANFNWVDKCNTAARQMSSRNTRCLFHALIDPTQTRSENVEMDQPFQLYDLRAALAKMKRGTAPGRDKITVKLLANLPDSAYQTLLDYINEIWREDTPLPIDWKTALVTFIPKAGRAINTDTLRPISLTFCVGKLMETMVRGWLSEYLETQHVFADTMFGFRPHRPHRLSCFN